MEVLWRYCGGIVEALWRHCGGIVEVLRRVEEALRRKNYFLKEKYFWPK